MEVERIRDLEDGGNVEMVLGKTVMLLSLSVCLFTAYVFLDVMATTVILITITITASQVYV